MIFGSGTQLAVSLVSIVSNPMQFTSATPPPIQPARPSSVLPPQSPLRSEYHETSSSPTITIFRASLSAASNDFFSRNDPSPTSIDSPARRNSLANDSAAPF